VFGSDRWLENEIPATSGLQIASGLVVSFRVIVDPGPEWTIVPVEKGLRRLDRSSSGIHCTNSPPATAGIIAKLRQTALGNPGIAQGQPLAQRQTRDRRHQGTLSELFSKAYKPLVPITSISVFQPEHLLQRTEQGSHGDGSPGGTNNRAVTPGANISAGLCATSVWIFSFR
jgi:hypothetical protein